jgi:cysteine desulfurase / selenocysteine lyase
MSTSERSAVPAPLGEAGGSPTADLTAIAKEIEWLANQFFSGVPGTALELPTMAPPEAPVAALPARVSAGPGNPLSTPFLAVGSPGALAPPHVAPSGLAIGAGGASPAVTAPPVPGPLKQPPVAVAPPPKESDLRTVPAMLSDSLGLPSPIALASAQEPSPSPPYFLELAGLPSSGSGASGPLVRGPWGPSAQGVGAGGAPRGVTVPPVSDAANKPPLSAPSPPKESDFRAFSSALSDGVGPGSPVGLVSAHDAFTSRPYFLELAGPTGGSIPAGGRPVPPPAPSVESTAHGQPGAPPPGFDHAPARAGDVPAPLSPPTSVSDPSGLLRGLPGWPTDRSSTDSSIHAVPVPPSAAPAVTTFDFRPELVPDLAPPSRLFDGHTIKRDFPILRERVHGRPLIWLDNAATTQKPQVVIDRLSYFYSHENSNVHRAAHALAARATDAYEAARETVRRFLNASSVEEIIFLRGTTEAINLVAQSWGRRNVGPGDEIVITWIEHHANIVPWQQLCAENGCRLRVAPVDARGQVVLEEYEKLLGPRTRLVSFSHVSNALGTILPVREMIEMAHRHGALAVVDGAQAVSHMRADVQALDCDFYCFSGHKIFAPTGIGVLFGKRDILNAMPPWQGGGIMISDVTFEKTTYQQAPTRFEAGTGSLADAVGLGAALDYLTALGLENVTRYEHELLVYATEGLARVPGLRMIGTALEKAAVLSFVLDGMRTEDVGEALDREGIAVRAGHHCAQPIIRRFGLESTVRASLALYNTREDVDALVNALQRLQIRRPRP